MPKNVLSLSTRDHLDRLFAAMGGPEARAGKFAKLNRAVAALVAHHFDEKEAQETRAPLTHDATPLLIEPAHDSSGRIVGAKVIRGRKVAYFKVVRGADGRIKQVVEQRGR